jgi:hypothetical protein
MKAKSRLLKRKKVSASFAGNNCYDIALDGKPIGNFYIRSDHSNVYMKSSFLRKMGIPFDNEYYTHWYCEHTTVTGVVNWLEIALGQT